MMVFANNKMSASAGDHHFAVNVVFAVKFVLLQCGKEIKFQNRDHVLTCPTMP